MSVEGTNNYDKIKDLFNKEASKFDSMVAAELDRVGGLMQSRAEMEAPVDTGYMASHIEKEITGKRYGDRSRYGPLQRLCRSGNLEDGGAALLFQKCGINRKPGITKDREKHRGKDSGRLCSRPLIEE